MNTPLKKTQGKKEKKDDKLLNDSDLKNAHRWLKIFSNLWAQILNYIHLGVNWHLNLLQPSVGVTFFPSYC